MPKGIYLRVPILARFGMSVDITGSCWEWKGALDSGGYGMIRGEMAHRYAYKLFKGDIPTGLTIDHLCRNRKRVNPNHLEPVTNRENIRRGVGRPERTEDLLPEGAPVRFN